MRNFKEIQFENKTKQIRQRIDYFYKKSFQNKQKVNGQQSFKENILNFQFYFFQILT